MARRLPVKARTTIAFGAVTGVLFAAVGIGLYLTVAAALLDGIDTGLRFRAATLQAQPDADLTMPGTVDPGLAEPGEALVQVTSGGTVLRASPPSMGSAVLPAEALRGLDGPAFFERRVPGMTGVTRLVAVPARSRGRPLVIVVGASMQDRADTLRVLAGFLGVAEPLALLLACVAGWRVAGAALDPVERMRREAAAVAVSGLDRRLSVPPTGDEIARLAGTLNEMLDRLESSMRAERRFLDTASHELRTPLATLRIELDLALARPRGLAETRAALVSASAEAERLTRLAEDLLVLSRADQGRLRVHPAEVPARALVTAAAERWRARVAVAGLRLVVDADDSRLVADPDRVRQAVDNLLDNAVRHSPAGGAVTVTAYAAGPAVRIVVTDDGPGFPAGVTAAGIGAWRGGAHGGGNDGAHGGGGLGLAIVRAIAEAHGGDLDLGNRPEGGARAGLSLPAAVGPGRPGG